MKKTFEQKDFPGTVGNGYASIARIAYQIGRRQAADLRKIRDVLEAGDEAAALSLMRDFFEFRKGSANEKPRARKQ